MVGFLVTGWPCGRLPQGERSRALWAPRSVDGDGGGAGRPAADGATARSSVGREARFFFGPRLPARLTSGLHLYFVSSRLFLGTEFSGRGRQSKGSSEAAVRDVQLRERPVAGLAAQGLPLVVAVGPVQPAVLGVREPLSPELSVPIHRLDSVVVAEPQPQPAPAEEQVEVSLPKAPPEEVPALLALVFAEPLVLAEPLAPPQPPVPGEAPRLLQEVLPVPQPPPLPRPLALPEGLRLRAGPPVLRLRPHRLPGGAQRLEGAIPDQVAQPNPISSE